MHDSLGVRVVYGAWYPVPSCLLRTECLSPHETCAEAQGQLGYISARCVSLRISTWSPPQARTEREKAVGTPPRQDRNGLLRYRWTNRAPEGADVSQVPQHDCD